LSDLIAGAYFMIVNDFLLVKQISGPVLFIVVGEVALPLNFWENNMVFLL
jgi:hypothetical protein